jgi:hypothetical protein
MKSLVWLLRLREAGLNLVFFHQYSTETCVRSNPGVGSSQDNVALLEKITKPRGNVITTSIKVVGALGFDGMASKSKLLINAVKTNKPKVLTGLNQKGNVMGMGVSSFPHRRHQTSPANRQGPNPSRHTSGTWKVRSTPRREGEP